MKQLKELIAILVVTTIVFAGCSAHMSLADRLDSINNSNDQKWLTQIALDKNESFIYREAAVKKLIDQAVLSKIAQDHFEHSNVRTAAIGQLTNQELLSKLVFQYNGNDSKAAAKGLTDQKLINKILANDSLDLDTRITLMNNLNDVALLHTLALTGTPRIVRTKAISKLSHLDSILISVTGNTNDITVDSDECIARLKLAINEPRIKLRFPDIECIANVSTRWNDYYKVEDPTKRIRIYGENIYIKLSEHDSTLADKFYQTNFPDKRNFPEQYIWAIVRGDDLLDSLFQSPVFTNEDLAELSHSEMPEVRIAADNVIVHRSELLIETLTDQSVLTRMAFDKNNLPGVRCSAVSKLTDQEVLTRLALEDSLYSIRLTATEKLTDQDVLANIAINQKDFNIRKSAIERLNDQVALKKIAFEEKDDFFRRSAIKRITDQEVLTKFASDGNDLVTRMSALKNLTDQALLAKFALEDNESSIRQSALENLEDQSILAKVATQDNEFAVRQSAVNKLIDKTLLTNISKTDPNSEVRKAALWRLSKLEK